MTTMSHTTTTPAPDHVATPTVLGRAIAAEATRLTSIRSTWWALAAATTMLGLLSVAFGTGSSGTEPVTTPGEAGMLFAQFALYVPVVLGVTTASTTRSIRTALQAVPRRGVLLTARGVVSVLTVMVAATLLALATDGVGALLLGSLAGADAGSIARSVTLVGVIVGFGASIALGLSFLLRSAAGVMTAMFLLMIVLPLLLPVFGIDALTTIAHHTPGKAMFSLLDAFVDETALSSLRAWAVLGGWSLGSIAAGATALFRRDAA